jgi:hydrogenase maturation protease
MRGVLVIACGNPLRGDDAVGGQIIETLRNELEDAGIAPQAVHQLTPELAEEISQTETVIFVDAAASSPAGTVAIKRIQKASAPLRFTHSLMPETLLALAHALYGKVPHESLLVRVGARRFDFSEKVSEEVEHSAAEAVAAIRSIVKSAIPRECIFRSPASIARRETPL